MTYDLGAKIILGMGAVVSAITLGLGSYILYDSTKEKVTQQNVRGNEKPETYVEVNGVKYYSHIDGKEISDVVKE